MTYWPSPRLNDTYSPVNASCCDHCRHDEVIPVTHSVPCARCSRPEPPSRIRVVPIHGEHA